MIHVHTDPDFTATDTLVTIDATMLITRMRDKCGGAGSSLDLDAGATIKLTLSDGLGERTIMSSIKEYYKPEELVGRKIIVLANLKPSRICNINSQGMLLAATNNACGCKVIFVDDSVPEGTAIH
jgi:hypothetical protein